MCDGCLIRLACTCLTCFARCRRPPVSVIYAVTRFQTLHAAYNESGVRHSKRPTFGEHLATVDGQAQLQALRELVETRLQGELSLQEELSLLPPSRLPGVP